MYPGEHSLKLDTPGLNYAAPLGLTPSDAASSVWWIWQA
ncbi:hypothetical protein HNQ65_004106 [Prosthecobacter vanneervenii]|uniref:Uncharacterized protein n=1 Tax=Prosthecobacter vanneervenii TaxID=48466 RepID=A0A7W7YE41_9BACT|nr:hypothetical protein [Prosthecobacter vanneervenii]